MWRSSAIGTEILINAGVRRDAIAHSPMCLNAMKLLAYAQEGDGIKLTKSESFYRRCVEWAAEEFQWPEWTPSDLYAVNRVLNEQDFLPLAVMHDLLLMARLIRHSKGKAMLTKTGRVVAGNCGAVQACLFDAYFISDLSADERFLVPSGADDLHHYLGVAQNRLGDWVRFADFAEWCLPIPLITRWRVGPEVDACYYLMSRVVRPLNWLGLLEIGPEQRQLRIEDRMLRKTALFENFLRVGVHRLPAMTVH